MPFSATASLISTDADNMLRGLYRDNANNQVANTATETDMATTTVTGGTIGATGSLLVFAAGTIANAVNNSKDIRLYLGATVLATVSRTVANAQDWYIQALITNTAANAQRVAVMYSTADATTVTFDYATSAIDTSSNQTLKVTGDMSVADAGNTITQTMFDVFVVQIA